MVRVHSFAMILGLQEGKFLLCAGASIAFHDPEAGGNGDVPTPDKE